MIEESGAGSVPRTNGSGSATLLGAFRKSMLFIRIDLFWYNEPLTDFCNSCIVEVEVKLRLRNPVVSKQIEQAQEKWLVVSF